MWLVLWTVIRFVPAPCPDYKPDPYTGEYPRAHCAVNHIQEMREEKTEQFPCKMQAVIFIENGPKGMQFTLKGPSGEVEVLEGLGGRE